ncbi:helix-turn-helix transcriptional regulator [Ruegeria atlantica]|uniref:helix-turn-helix transcriptional regulator n=1 Tax=Ruegeria atlantica TaxID=81569 RepID=UPI00147DF140|nr:YafY family protein [Ruegeria atlantica]
MKSSRLLSILIRLQTRGQMTADQLAEELEVSPRTIHRDIDQLSYAGVPVFAERGRNGGYKLLDGYQTRLTGLDADEASCLLLSGLGAVLDDLGLLEAANQTELKVLASLPNATRDHAAIVSERFFLDPVSWYRKKEEAPFVRKVAAAVWAQQQLSIRYESWKGVVERIVSPLAIVFKAGSWYLVALVDTPRVYKIAKIQSIEALDKVFSRPEKFNIREFWDVWRTDFELRLKSQTVMLKVTSEGLRLLNEMGVAPDTQTVTHKVDGLHIVTVQMEYGAITIRSILSLGKEVEVISPMSLRKNVIAEIHRIAGHYSS